MDLKIIQHKPKNIKQVKGHFLILQTSPSHVLSGHQKTISLMIEKGQYFLHTLLLYVEQVIRCPRVVTHMIVDMCCNGCPHSNGTCTCQNPIFCEKGCGTRWIYIGEPSHYVNLVNQKIEVFMRDYGCSALLGDFDAYKFLTCF
jgi:hypothetical protein